VDRPTCKTCMYYDDMVIEPDDPVGVLGVCRRFPPVFVGPMASKVDRGWAFSEEFWIQPWVSGRGCCGEHPDFPAYLASRRTAASNSADLDATRE
jgi:hypothetical protein